MCKIENTCYVCYEECQKLSACECKYIYLHDNCQLKIIKSLNSTVCTVCKHEYKNVHQIDKHRYTRYNKNCWYMIMLVFLSFMLSLISITEIVVGTYLIMNYDSKIFVIFYVILLLMSCSFLLFIKIKTIIFLKNVYRGIIEIRDEVQTVYNIELT